MGPLEQFLFEDEDNAWNREDGWGGPDVAWKTFLPLHPGGIWGPQTTLKSYCDLA